jgi:hypothetical protein
MSIEPPPVASADGPEWTLRFSPAEQDAITAVVLAALDPASG